MYDNKKIYAFSVELKFRFIVIPKKLNFYFPDLNPSAILFDYNSYSILKKMKVAVVLALLLVASFASSFEEVKAIVKNDQCAESTLEMIKPQIHEQIQNLKKVNNTFYFRILKTSPPRLNF